MQNLITIVVAVGACGFGAVFGIAVTNLVSQSVIRARVARGLYLRKKEEHNSLTEPAVKAAKRLAESGGLDEIIRGGGLLIGEPGGIRYSDGYLERVLGREWDDIKDDKWLSLIHPDDLLPTFEAIASPSGTVINRWRGSRGGWCHVSFAWERDVDSGVGIVVVHDVTSKRIRSKAAEAIASVRDELSGVHQIVQFRWS